MHIEDEVVDAMLKAAAFPYSNTDRERMRAAADVLTPVVLAKALAEPSEAEMIKTATDRDTNWSFATDYPRVQRIFANRLRSLQAKPDPRIEVVKSVIKHKFSNDDQTLTERILNALDEYDRRDATK